MVMYQSSSGITLNNETFGLGHQSLFLGGNMSFAELFVLAIGLSMDAFAVSICMGLSLKEIKSKHMLSAGLWFGGFQALMPLLGYFLGNFLSDLVNKYAPYIAFGLLVFLGGKMIKEAIFENDESLNASMNFTNMLMLAIATSIDALSVGVTFAFLKVHIWAAIIFIGITTFTFSFVGIKIGSIFGTKYKKIAEISGGIILIIIGIRVLIEGMGIL